MNRTHIGLGIFVVVTIGLLVWLAQSIGAIGGGRGKHYEVRLIHAAGLVENNAVKIAGVDVGRIATVEVDHNLALLTLEIEPQIQLHEDTTAIVRAKSLLGEKYLQLDPGTREAPLIPPGGEISHIDEPFEIDQVLNALQPILGGDESIAATLGPLAEQLNELLADATGKRGKPAVISREQLTQIVADLTETAAVARRIAEANEEDLRSLVEGARVLVGDPRLARILGDTERVTHSLAERVPNLLERAERLVADLEPLIATFDDKRSRQLGQAVDDGAAALANLRKLSAELKDLEGTIGPIARGLRKIVERASRVDEPLIRRFLQVEGVKIYVGSKKAAQEATRSQLEP